MVNAKIVPIVDKEIEKYWATKKLNLVATTDEASVKRDASLVIFNTMTKYDSNKNYFDISSVEAIVE